MLRGAVAERARELIRQTCEMREVQIVRGAVSADHGHILVSAQPRLAPAKLVQYIKRRSSRRLQEEFPHLKKKYWGQEVWAWGYFCVTVRTCVLRRREAGAALAMAVCPVLPSTLHTVSALRFHFFGAQSHCPHVPLPRLHPCPRGQRRMPRGESCLGYVFDPRDFQPLPFYQLAWRTCIQPLGQSMSGTTEAIACNEICAVPRFERKDSA